jgi:hypothetical protein
LNGQDRFTDIWLDFTGSESEGTVKAYELGGIGMPSTEESAVCQGRYAYNVATKELEISDIENQYAPFMSQINGKYKFFIDKDNYQFLERNGFRFMCIK